MRRRGSMKRDPGLDPVECPYCGEDGYREDKGTYCHCRAGRELLVSEFELLSEAAVTPHEHEEKAA